MMIEKNVDLMEQVNIEVSPFRRVREFIYSESLGKYIASQPLRVDERVVRAAVECGIELNWDDEGRISNISFVEAKKIMKKLGGTLLSPSEYWQMYQEAVNHNDQEMLKQLQSKEFAEWLDVIFEKGNDRNIYMIEHPEIVEQNGKVVFEGKKVRVDIPEGRPGWFNPQDNINIITGTPLHIDLNRAKGTAAWSSSTWKYWSFYNCYQGITVAPIRGYVTSSGTPSLDLDLPVQAKEAALMIRESRKELIAPPLEENLIKKAEEFINRYLMTTVNRPAVQNPQDHESFYQIRQELFSFLSQHGREFIDNRDKYVQQIKEKFIDMLGIIRIMAKAKHETTVVQEVEEISHELFNSPTNIAINDFTNFIKETKSHLKEGLVGQKRIILVMGHKNPDTDTVISALMEAYRNSLIDNGTIYIPVVQGWRIPDEVRRLLGNEIADSIILTDDSLYDDVQKSGQARWILVDQNVSQVQKFVLSIIDHHILSEKAKRQDIIKTWEMAGSTTALITQKLHGLGIDVDSELAKMLYGATLMDTENRSEKKTTYKDKLIMDGLRDEAKLENEKNFYQDLMSYLLNTDDAELLFNRDYKQDWGIFGFAVAKVKKAFSENGEMIKKDLLEKLVRLAEKNNREKNFPVTIVKVADYLEDNETVNKERVYLIFNQYAPLEFCRAMFDFIKTLIEHEFNGRAETIYGDNYIDFSGVGDQLSRKVTAPFLEPIVTAFNEYYYSPSTGLYVKREFLKYDNNVKEAATALGIELSVDEEGRINNITYHEAKQLLSYLGLTMMSLPEYWRVLAEANKVRDEQMQQHLKSRGFVEFLDTVILNGKETINHPTIKETEERYVYDDGTRYMVDILDGRPGLIYPADIDLNTGFPNKVYSCTHYGDKTMWRYWMPDAPVCIPTRGHIFLLNQVALDTKIHPDDALPNLGIRPCCYKVRLPKVKIIKETEGVKVEIIKD